MKFSGLLWFAAGIGVGVGASAIAWKKKRAKIEEEISVNLSKEYMELLRGNYISKGYDEIAEESVTKEDVEEEPVEDLDEDKIITQQDMDEIKKKLDYNYKKTTDYSRMYDNVEESEDEDNEDDEPDEILEEIGNTWADIDGCVIISSEEAGEIPHDEYCHELLYYYIKGDFYTDEDDCLIDETSRGITIGIDCDREIMKQPDGTTVFVLNNELSTVYEILVCAQHHADNG